MMSAEDQLGTDFSQVWVAGKEALAGAPEAPFDITRHVAAQRAEFGPHAAIYGWHYPPYFLSVAALLAHLPYLRALFLWQALTLAAYLVAIALLGRDQKLPLGPLLLAALAFPAVMVNLGHGQNGFLTAALLSGGYLALQRRPILAGVFLALLAYKPQFGLAIPLALLFDRRWRALASAAATLALMTAASAAVFGVSSWRAFFDGLAWTRKFALEQGGAGFDKIESVFAAARLLGGSVDAAYWAQGVAGMIAIAGLLWLWRSGADRRAKIAAIPVATLLTTPYCLDYDFLAYAPALALLAGLGAEKGFAPFEKSVLAFAFVAPLIARPIAGAVHVPLGVIALAALFLCILRRGVAPTAKAEFVDAPMPATPAE
jgi:hypothetical protein